MPAHRAERLIASSGGDNYSSYNRHPILPCFRTPRTHLSAAHSPQVAACLMSGIRSGAYLLPNPDPGLAFLALTSQVCACVCVCVCVCVC